MRSSRHLLPAVTVLALVIAAPAGALTGYGAAGQLHVATLPTLTTSTAEQKRTCQAKSGRQQATGKHALVGTIKKPAVVACEQPPRSQVLTQGLKQAGTAALATFG